MIKRISPPIGRVWSDEDLVSLVQIFIAIKRAGVSFFELPITKSFDKELLEFLLEFYDNGGVDSTVYLYPDETQPVASWRITPGRNGLGVWLNVKRV